MTDEPDRERFDRWEELAAHREQLLIVARHRTATEQDAEDVVQEALLRAWTYQGLRLETAAAWMTRVVINLSVDSWRWRRRLTSLDALEGSPATGTHEDGVCDQAEAVWVAQHVGRLPVRQARALHLKAEGLSVSEISSTMQVPVSAGEALLKRARVAMRAVVSSTWNGALAAWVGNIRRRSMTHGPLVPVTVTAVVASVAWGIGVGTPPQERDHTLRPPADRTIWQAHVAPGPSAPVSRPKRASIRPARSRLDPPRGAVLPPKSFIAPPADEQLGPAHAQGGGVTASHHESVVESVERCVAGFTISTTHVGCPDSAAV